MEESECYDIYRQVAQALVEYYKEEGRVMTESDVLQKIRTWSGFNESTLCSDNRVLTAPSHSRATDAIKASLVNNGVQAIELEKILGKVPSFYDPGREEIIEKIQDKSTEISARVIRLVDKLTFETIHVAPGQRFLDKIARHFGE